MLKWFILVPFQPNFYGTNFDEGSIYMLWIPIDRSLDISLIRQVYHQIRERILNGEL